MITLYEELFGLFEQKEGLPDEQFRSTFVCMRPKKEDSVKLMLVGRATNGWGDKESDSEYLPRKAGEFSKRAQELFEDTTRWGWIPENFKIPYQEGGIDKIYNINRSPFWNYTKDIYKELSKESSQFLSKRWFESIAWSNLYKISPTTGNPNIKSLRRQEVICSRILNHEIETIKPKHILFETGLNWVFENIRKERSIYNNDHVEWAGTYMGAKCVVSCRPECKKKERFVNDVVEAFKKIKLSTP